MHQTGLLILTIVSVYTANALIPTNVVDAWKWKQLSGIIDEIIEEPYESL